MILEIIVGLLVYFILMYTFRIVFVLFLVRMISQIKRQLEDDIKEKLSKLKGDEKENEM